MLSQNQTSIEREREPTKFVIRLRWRIWEKSNPHKRVLRQRACVCTYSIHLMPPNDSKVDPRIQAPGAIRATLYRHTCNTINELRLQLNGYTHIPFSLATYRMYQRSRRLEDIAIPHNHHNICESTDTACSVSVYVFSAFHQPTQIYTARLHVSDIGVGRVRWFALMRWRWRSSLSVSLSSVACEAGCRISAQLIATHKTCAYVHPCCIFHT